MMERKLWEARVDIRILDDGWEIFQGLELLLSIAHTGHTVILLWRP